jgi:hypothetical protein
LGANLWTTQYLAVRSDTSGQQNYDKSFASAAFFKQPMENKEKTGKFEKCALSRKKPLADPGTKP